jgi:superfamily II DNA/RNA helicase
LPLLIRTVAGSAGRSGRQGRPGPRAMVLVPTRELARQVHDELTPLAAPLGLRLLAVYGGAPMRTQVQALWRGTDVVVATPGRLTDLLRQGACSLDAVEVAVLDEADHMADMGFLPAVTWLLDRVPAGGQRLLFSATLDNGVDIVVRRYLNDPVCHAVAPATAAAVTRMDHRFVTVTAVDKVTVAAELAGRSGRVLLFVRTKRGAARLVRQLDRAGVRAGALHGDLPQRARERALAAFAADTVPILVATDVAARGIHVDGVDLVVHFDPPADHKAYLHRSGRTARAGAAGSVVTLVLPEQMVKVAKLRQRAGVPTEPASSSAHGMTPSCRASMPHAAGGDTAPLTAVAELGLPVTPRSTRGPRSAPSRSGSRGRCRRVPGPRTLSWTAASRCAPPSPLKFRRETSRRGRARRAADSVGELSD